MRTDIIIRDSIEGIGTGEVSLYLAHILCHEGSCTIRFNGMDFMINSHDCCIIRATQLIESVMPSEDFKVTVIYATPIFIEKATPNTNYGMRGSISLSQNPVMHLTDEEYYRCLDDFNIVCRRMKATGHRFHQEMMFSVMCTLILDFFDFHLRINGPSETPSSQGAFIMGKFIGMLGRGDYRQIREVSHYASELCITPKYLSEISRKLTGFPANWWINRFTILDISRQLRDRSQSISDISETFNFTSPSYFCRYVQRYLGESPSEFRG